MADDIVVISDDDIIARRFAPGDVVGGTQTYKEVIEVEGFDVTLGDVNVDTSDLNKQATQLLVLEQLGTISGDVSSVKTDSAAMRAMWETDGFASQGGDGLGEMVDRVAANTNNIDSYLAGILEELNGTGGENYLAAEETLGDVAASLMPGGTVAELLSTIDADTGGIVGNTSDTAIRINALRTDLAFLTSPGIHDAFGRLRVSQPATIFDAKCIVDNQPLVFSDVAASGAGTSSTHSVDKASVTLGVSNTTAGKRVRQSKRRIAYQPGKSQLAFLTFTFGEAAAGITRKVGLFDDNNGIFLRQTETELAWVRRSHANGSVVDTVAESVATWTNMYPLSGGEDPIVLDMTKAQIAFIDFEWLGVGVVRCGFVIDGELHYVYTFTHANHAAGVYMSTPNLPVRWSIENDGTGAAATIETICASVISEGGHDKSGMSRNLDRGLTGLTTLNDSDMYPLIAMRLKDAALGATVRPTDMSVFCTTDSVFRWALLLNPTVAGTALSFSDVTDASIQSDVARTSGTKVSGGTLLASGYIQSTGQNNIPSTGSADYALGSAVDGTSDILVLAVQRITGTTETFFGTLGYTDQI